MSSLGKTLKKYGGAALSIAAKSPVGKAALAMVPGVGPILAGAATAYSIYEGLKSPSTPSAGPGSSLSPMPSLSMGLVSPGAVASAGRVVMTGARAAAKGAVNLCRKYPQWCSTIGGTAAVEALIHSGQIPAPKHRRGRGITAHELKAFKRVARFTSRYCAPVHRAMKAPAVRKGASCR